MLLVVLSPFHSHLSKNLIQMSRPSCLMGITILFMNGKRFFWAQGNISYIYTFVRFRGYMCLVTVANKYIKAFFRYPVIDVSKIVTGESPGTIEYIR